MKRSLFTTTRKATNCIRDLDAKALCESTDRNVYETIYAINCMLDAADEMAKIQEEILGKLDCIEAMNKELLRKLEVGAR